MNAHQVTRDFEKALCEYTGAPYAVAVNSCTMALLLATHWHLWFRRPMLTDASDEKRCVGTEVEIPKRTYVGVPYAIREAGGKPTFREEDWCGLYQLYPLPVFDSARWLTSDMYYEGQMICLSFHASKTLGDSQGGAILHDDPEADKWLRRARFDGRTEGVPPREDDFTLKRAWHCYLSPDVATRLLWHLSVLPKHNAPLPNDDYPDLSELEIFK